MAFFSRKRSRTPSAQSSANTIIGRKFSSALSLDECLENFSNAASQCYPVAGDLTEVDWSAPTEVAGISSSQGGPAEVPPARFVVQGLAGSGQLYLAVWDGLVGYGGTGAGGQSREMWFVPPGFDGSPISIAGTWKGLDGSLSSIGTVESAFWGV